MTTVTQTAVLSLAGVSKSYGPVRALADVSLEVHPGRVHALLGENGAGKSTLMGVASGSVRPDEGRITVAGEHIPALTTDLATRMGIAIVHQHPAVLPDMTVAENIRVAVPAERMRTGGDTRRWMTDLLHKVGSRVRLAEVRQIADEVTVLRDGRVRGSSAVADIDDDQLLRMIVGRELETTFPPKNPVAESETISLNVTDLSGDGFHDARLTVRHGEIVGLAGIVGNGQSQFLRALAGLVRCRSTPHTPYGHRCSRLSHHTPAQPTVRPGQFELDRPQLQHQHLRPAGAAARERHPDRGAGGGERDTTMAARCAVDRAGRGDILVAGPRCVLVGVGRRTSPDGAEALADELLRRYPDMLVIAVALPCTRQTMHLDTVAALVDEDAILVSRDDWRLWTTYRLEPGPGDGIRATRLEDAFHQIAEALGVSRVRVIHTGGDALAQRREQWTDAANVLALRPGVTVACDRNVNTNYALAQDGITVLTTSSAELSRGRGGPHCLTAPLLRR